MRGDCSCIGSKSVLFIFGRSDKCTRPAYSSYRIAGGVTDVIRAFPTMILFVAIVPLTGLVLALRLVCGR